MGYKMKGAPMIANTKSHGTNKNYKMSGMTNADGTASGAPFMKGLGKMAGNFIKGKGAMGFLNPVGAIANKAGLFDKRPEGNNVMGQEPAQAQAEQPNPNTVAQDPSVQEGTGAPKLKGGQHKIDMNKDGKISKTDFDMMSKKGAPKYKKKGAPNYKKGYYGE